MSKFYLVLAAMIAAMGSEAKASVCTSKDDCLTKFECTDQDACMREFMVKVKDLPGYDKYQFDDYKKQSVTACGNEGDLGVCKEKLAFHLCQGSKGNECGQMPVSKPSAPKKDVSVVTMKMTPVASSPVAAPSNRKTVEIKKPSFLDRFRKKTGK